MSSNALLWPSQGTKPEERLDKYKYLRLPSQGVGVTPPQTIDSLLAIYPPLGDTDYLNYKFYQVTKGQFAEPVIDFIWEITDSVGPGVFLEASGFDIRPFLNDAVVLLDYEVTSVNVTTGDFTIKVEVTSIQDLSFVQLTFGNAAAIDNSIAQGAGTTLSTFETPLLTKDEDNFLVDDMGRNIVAVQV